MGGGLESRCVGRVYGADGAVAFHFISLSVAFVAYIFMCRVYVGRRGYGCHILAS